MVSALIVGATRLSAQGVTTSAISGTVTGDQNQPLEGVQIQVTNRATGARAGTVTRGDGRYYIQGLEPGGPYTVAARRIGLAPQEKNDLRVSLGQNLRVDFQLATQVTRLEAAVTTAATENAIISRSHTGVGTTVTDTMIGRLPSLNRDFTDFAKLTPQVSTSASGLSGGGVNNRFNSIQIDGSTNNDLFGLSSTSTPGGLSGAKTIPIDAVKEYQVLLSPFDVRQGSFTGLLVNAVTKGGTNDFSGSAFIFYRDSALQREQPYLTGFNQKQYGLTLGGPIVRDRAFFFFAMEKQDLTQPSSGPYIGSPDAPTNQAAVDAFNSALSKYGISGGTGEALVRKNPNTNWFARVDVNLPWNSRLVLRHNYVFADQVSFSRSASGSQQTFPLTSNSNGITNKSNSTVAQIFTNLSNGLYNELLVSRNLIRDFRTVPITAPEISVFVPKTSGTGLANLVAGTERSSQGNELVQNIFEITDNVTIPWRNHAFTIGTRNQFYYTDNLFAQNRFGTWQFSSLDSLNGTCANCGGQPRASSLIVNVPVGGGDGRARFNAGSYSFYVQDAWEPTQRLTLNIGLRADLPFFDDTPALNQNLLNEIGRRTDEIPSKQVQWSPRIGANWDVTGDSRNQLRAGIGLFSGPPAYVWMSNAFGNTGVYGYASITCNSTSATAANRPPAFNAQTANAATPPTQCGGGQTPALGANVNLIRDDFRYPQDMKMSAGYDHKFEKGILAGATGTIEGLYSRAVYSPFYENIALDLPSATARDHNGRVMYGTLSATGSTPKLRAGTSRQQILDLTNSNKDYSYNISTSLSKRFNTALEGMIAYTYSQAYDVQSVLNSTAGSNWGQGRDISGYHTDKTLAHAKWEQPHRIVASGTYTFRRTLTDITMFYEGRSGGPFDYVYGPSSAAGDVNGDSRAGNDLVYVPANVRDTNEIKFTGYNVAAQAASVKAMQDGLDQFINEQPCLNEQRGRIMERNSCHNPWNNEVNVSVRQNISAIRGQRATLQVDIFNFGNLLNRNWGLQRSSLSGGLAGAFLMNRTGVTTDSQGRQQGIFTYSPVDKYGFRTVGSNYRIQLSAKYAF